MDKKIYEAVSNRADGECEVCHRSGNLELHHILRRKVPATVSNCIMLCYEHHRGTYGVHGKEGHELDFKLKLELQKKYTENYPTMDLKTLMGGRFYW